MVTKPIPKGATEPLIAALLARLPRPGGPGEVWPGDARVAWLRMLANAFDVVYGPELPIAIGLGGLDQRPWPSVGLAAPPPVQTAPAEQLPIAPPKREPHQVAGCDFYVDSDGYVRCDHTSADGVAVPSPKRRVLPEEVMGHQVYEYRGARRDRETVIWADDSVGAGPGMEFCGPG